MGVLAFLRGDEERAIRTVPWGMWGSGADLTLADRTANSAAGVRVDEHSSLAHAAFFACVKIRAELLSAMPIDVYRDGPDETKEELPTPKWLDSPNVEQDITTFMVMASWSMDTDGNVFIVPTRDARGQIVELWLLDPKTVTVRRDSNHRRLYMVDGREFNGEIIHRTYHLRPGQVRGLNPIEFAAETIGVGLAANNYGAEFLANGAVPPVVIEAPGTVDDESQKKVLRNWSRRHGAGRRHTPGLLTGGATAHVLGMSPDQTQAFELKRMNAIEVCAYYGVPPEFVGVGVDGSGSITYQNLEGAWVALIRRALMHPMRVFERMFSELLPGPVGGGQRMRFRPEVFMKADTAQRFLNYKVGIDAKFLLPNEARAFEDWDPIPGGDKFPAAPKPAVAPPQPGAIPPPAPTDTQPPTPVEQIQRSVGSGTALDPFRTNDPALASRLLDEGMHVEVALHPINR